MILALSGNPFYDYSPRLFGMPASGAGFGLGATPTAAQFIGAAGAGVSTGINTQSIVGGSVAAGLATAALFDPEPISKAILAISAAFVAPLMQLVNRGCGQTCIVASQAADQAAQSAQQIKDAYFGTPTPRPRSLQVAALQALQNVADALRQACSNPALGDAGRRCISERLDRTACAIKDSSGGCHNYFIDFVDPIANDSNVVDPSTVEGAAAQIQQALGISITPMMLLAAGLLVAGVVLL